MGKVKVVHGRNAWQADGDGLIKPDTEGTGYVLPQATATVLGGIRVGDRLAIDNGRLSAVDQSYDDTEVRDLIDEKQDELVSGDNIKTINGESILGAGDITINPGGDYELPTASSTVLGGVKVGSRLTIAPDGTLSAVDQSYDDSGVRAAITSNTEAIGSNAAAIATKQDALNSGVNIKTVNGQSLVGSGDVVIGGGGGDYVLPPATATTLGGVKTGARVSIAVDGTISADDQSYDDAPLRAEIDEKQDELVSGTSIKTVGGQTLLGSGDIPFPTYVPPIASTTVRGVVMIGDRLSVDGNGLVTADDQSYDDTEVRDLIDEKQDALVSGDNIKTINGQTILGDGNLVISGGGGDYTLPPATVSTIGGVKPGTSLAVEPDGKLNVTYTYGNGLARFGDFIYVQPNAQKGIINSPAGVEAKLDPNGGLKFGDGTAGIGIKVDPASALTVDADGLGVDLPEPPSFGNGLVTTGGVTSAKAANGISIDSSGIGVKVDPASALSVTSAGVTVNLPTPDSYGNGLTKSGTTVTAKPANGIQVDANGIGAKTAASSSITVDANGIDVKVSPTGRLSKLSTGLHVLTGPGIAAGNSITVQEGVGINVDTLGGVYVDVAPTLKIDANSKVAANGADYGSTGGVTANLFASATVGLWTKNLYRSALTTVPGFSSATISRATSPSSGRVTQTHTGTATTKKFAALAMFDPGRSDIPFMGTCRVTINDGTPFIVPYFDGFGWDQTGPFTEKSVGTSTAADVPMVLGADASAPLGANHNWTWGEAPFKGRLFARIALPIGTTKVVVDHFFLTPPGV